MNGPLFDLPKAGRSTDFFSPRCLGFGLRRNSEGGTMKTPSGNQCAQCGEVLVAPEWSEHFPDNRIRNVWLCEACGYEFEDIVRWSRRELVDAE